MKDDSDSKVIDLIVDAEFAGRCDSKSAAIWLKMEVLYYNLAPESRPLWCFLTVMQNMLELLNWRKCVLKWRVFFSFCEIRWKNLPSESVMTTNLR